MRFRKSILILYLLAPQLGLHLAWTDNAFGQCGTLPGGSIALTNSFNGTTIAGGSTYYVPTGTTVKLDYSSIGNLTISGTIIIQSSAVLYLKMSNNNITINGTIQVCNHALFEIDTAHDLTMNSAAALINVATDGTVEFCHFGHDFNPSAGTIALGDYASFEMIDYHSFNNADNDIFTYTGSGTVGIGTGDPIVHFGFSGAAGYADQNTAASNYTASSHIDIINDDLGTDKPGSGNYCGPQALTDNLACRSQWTGLATSCFAAPSYQSGEILLPINSIALSGTNNNDENTLTWTVVSAVDVVQVTIQRSQDGASFGTLDSLKIVSEGQLTKFKFADEQPLVGNNYYRIVVKDASGNLYLSKTIDVVNAGRNSSNIMVIYPNPFTDKVTFVINASTEPQILASLWDINGKKLQEKTFSMQPGQNRIVFENLGLLVRGIYLVKIGSAIAGNEIFKIVKL